MKDGEYEIKYDVCYSLGYLKNTDDKNQHFKKVGGLLLDKTVTESAKAEATVAL